MTHTAFIALLFGALICFIVSCKTYYIPVESFKQQFAGMDTSQMRNVTTQGPMGDKTTYETYPIDYIKAVDKGGNPVLMKNSPTIELRFTDTANKKTIFYLNLMQFDGENIIGSQSRFATSIKRTIKINGIKKIEVQNGRKNFQYID